MAKRSAKDQDRKIRLSSTQLRQPGMEKPPKSERAAEPVSSGASELAEEYRYVAADLKRIAVIAVVMLTVLVVLALLLP